MATARNATPSPADEIPDKLYFKIGEVADLVGVQTHVLRYWEKEIPSIRPAKSASNQRRYRRKDVEIFREIRRLLYQERYTLAGARKRLMGRGESPEPAEVQAPAPPVAAAPAPEPQPVPLTLVQRSPEDRAKLERARTGLRELIRLAGEEP